MYKIEQTVSIMEHTGRMERYNNISIYGYKYAFYSYIFDPNEYAFEAGMEAVLSTNGYLGMYHD